MIRAAGFSPVTVAIALLGGAIAAAVAGLRGLALFAGAVIASRIVSAVIVAVLAEIETRDRRRADRGELLVWLPRVVQAVATLTSIAVLDGVIRTVDGILATLVYAGCVLLGWTVRKAVTPAIAGLVERLYWHDERLAMDGRGVSDARIREWNAAWTRALEHLDRERRARPPAG